MTKKNWVAIIAGTMALTSVPTAAAAQEAVTTETTTRSSERNDEFPWGLLGLLGLAGLLGRNRKHETVHVDNRPRT